MARRVLIALTALAVAGAALLWATRPGPPPPVQGAPAAAPLAAAPAPADARPAAPALAARVPEQAPAPPPVPNDPFKAFMEGKGEPVMVTPGQVPPGTDPFRAALERSKQQPPATGVSPFGTPRP